MCEDYRGGASIDAADDDADITSLNDPDDREGRGPSKPRASATHVWGRYAGYTTPLGYDTVMPATAPSAGGAAGPRRA